MDYRYQAMADSPALAPTDYVRREEHDVDIDFDRDAGFRYSWITPSLCLPCCAPLFALIARKVIDAQKCTVTDRRVVFEYGWLDHSIKSIPLDRIQDVNVRQDCIQKCFGVKVIEIQTAGMGGSDTAEAQLIAPRDAIMVRDIIMDRRDALVLGHPVPVNGTAQGGDAKGPSAHSERIYNQASHSSHSSDAVVEELQSIKETLSRLNANVQIGVDRLAPSQETYT